MNEVSPEARSQIPLDVSVTQFPPDHCYQLCLQPAMRPFAAQLLQHERLELFNWLTDAEKTQVQSPLPHLIFVLTSLFSYRFSVVRAHHATVSAKEHEILVQDQALLQNEQGLASLFNQKKQEITSLQQFVLQLQQQQQQFLRQYGDQY